VLHVIWKFLDTAENNVDAGDLLSTLLNRFGQRLNMAVYAVIDDKYFHPFLQTMLRLLKTCGSGSGRNERLHTTYKIQTIPRRWTASCTANVISGIESRLFSTAMRLRLTP